MARKGTAKEVFPGGNTGKGFHSFYDYIIPEDANRIFILKGGPGVGKSSFMRNIAKELMELGFDVELHHCSSDNNSLDGVVIPAISVALIDGTAPHIVDPKNPGAVDEILNLGEYWDEKAMVKGKEAVLSCNREIRKNFYSSYHYLASAKEIQSDIESIINSTIDKVKFNNMLDNVKIKNINSLERKTNVGKERHLFDSAITPDGLWDYIDTIIPRRYECNFIKGEIGAGQTELLKSLADEYVFKGYDVELYHQPLNPDRLQTLVVDELKIAYTVNTRMERKSTNVIDLDSNIKKDLLIPNLADIEKDKDTMSILFEEAVNRISRAKKIHDEMEKSYIPHMDFNSITELRIKTAERIKKIAGI